MERLLNTTLVLLCGVVFGMLPAAVMADMTTAPSTTSVETAAPSDESLKPMVESTLAPYTDKVTVSVANGVVSLSGQLDSDTDYEKVVTLAEAIPGVTDVNADNLTVKDSTSPMNDTYITAKVKGALLESDIMGKDIPSWSVSVETKNGEVYLSGTVASEQERQTIVTIAKKVKGVTKVNDQMEISAATTKRS